MTENSNRIGSQEQTDLLVTVSMRLGNALQKSGNLFTKLDIYPDKEMLSSDTLAYVTEVEDSVRVFWESAHLSAGSYDPVITHAQRTMEAANALVTKSADPMSLMAVLWNEFREKSLVSIAQKIS